MELKIIGGIYRGLKLSLDDANSDFRPTKNQIREALMSILVADIAKASVLELCAGSAIISLEFLSRGATKAVAVEKEPARIRKIGNLIKGREIETNFNFIQSDTESYLAHCTETFDLVFFDPPYYSNELTDTIPKVFSLLNEYGILIYEFASDDSYATMIISSLQGCSTTYKKYGNSSIAIIRSN